MKLLKMFAAVSIFFLISQACSGAGNEANHRSGMLHEKPADLSDGLRSGPDKAQSQHTPSNPAEKAEQTACRMSLSYTIGEIDPRFSLAEQDVKRLMDRAVMLWAGALDHLEVDSNASDGIVVQFIYDERQAMTDNERGVQDRLQSRESEINVLGQAYEQMLTEFDTRSMEHRVFSESLLQRIDQLNEWVNNQNEAGGFTDEDVVHFESEKAAIEQLQQQEAHKREELEKMASEINAAMDQFNRKIDENNRLVDLYNEEFAGGSRFTSGNYEWKGDHRTITVYHFRNEPELILVLAHELGHALGMSHVSNPGSIMYETMAEQLLSEQLQLSRQDRQAIRNLCNRE